MLSVSHSVKATKMKREVRGLVRSQRAGQH